jgi:hypothetical protein
VLRFSGPQLPTGSDHEQRCRNSPKRSAEANGRSLESELIRPEQSGRARMADFPVAGDWIRAGFDNALELIPGH